ncbi:DUF262 domain-containing protein [Haloplanus rubicundus]|uniref:DUF262 domain-containing protein n=1 Tax=Haloplanus rubicundus TaxID=1547898 RepID=A0A345E0E5_9EURY|nr:DUF262 domain-containing protein [Haloplanus rubicundus]AXG05667.1 DUF262 domain-containing protein [Haloplanus rubicundus]
MTYQSKTIANIITDINSHYFLPGIQREFVWDKEQMIQLFDSVIRGYPIGSFLFWNTRGKFAEKQIKYEFVQHYITEGVYPDEFDDVRYRNAKVRDEFSTDLPNRLTLVLDGQQRLTTFYIGLKGSLTDRGYRKLRKKPESWTRKKLYINLLSDPSHITEDDRKLKYLLEFKPPDPSHSASEYWYPVGDILDVQSADERYALVDEIQDELEAAGVSPGAINRSYIEQNLNELWRSIHERDTINYYELDSKYNNNVLDIFIRANEGGTQLGKEEMLLSMATAKWSEGADPIDARKKITTLVDRLNGYDAQAGFDFDIGFILRNLLTASELSSKYDIQNFSDSNLQQMKDVFQDPEFEEALFDTLDLVDTYGLDGHAVSSTVSLIPIVYFFYNHDNIRLGWDAKDGRQTRTKLFYWLCSTLLKGVYHSAPYTLINSIRNDIREAPDGTFPLEELHSSLLSNGKSLTFIEEEVRDMVQKLNYGNKRVEVFLSLLYFPEPASQHETFEVDHIFPRSELSQENLIDNYGMEFARASRYDSLSDNILNLQFLTPKENSEKSDQSYKEWLNTRHESQIERHYIPRDDELYEITEFEQFLKEREDLIVDRLLQMSDEIEKQFGTEEGVTASSEAATD